MKLKIEKLRHENSDLSPVPTLQEELKKISYQKSQVQIFTDKLKKDIFQWEEKLSGNKMFNNFQDVINVSTYQGISPNFHIFLNLSGNFVVFFVMAAYISAQ